jgi:hypothetical protein
MNLIALYITVMFYSVDKPSYEIIEAHYELKLKAQNTGSALLPLAS